jgi:hypothetical protein
MLLDRLRQVDIGDVAAEQRMKFGNLQQHGLPPSILVSMANLKEVDRSD